MNSLGSDSDHLIPESLETGVYALECSNGGVYIGSTARLGFRRRIQSHLLELKKNRHHSRRLQFCWNKYGAEGFRFRILEVVQQSQEEQTNAFKRRVLDREQQHLDGLSPRSRLNSSSNAISCLGVKASPAQKEAASKRMKELWKDPDYRKKVVDGLALSNTSDYRQKLSDVHRRRCESPEWRSARSARTVKNWQNPAYREKIERSRALYVDSPEYREKLSKSQKKRYENPEARKDQSRMSKLRALDPQCKAKHRLGCQKAWSDPANRDAWLSSFDKGRTSEARKKAAASLKARHTDPDFKKKHAQTVQRAKASSNLPAVLISPESIQYVTDSVAGFARLKGLSQGNLSSPRARSKGWTIYKLQSWAEVPAEAIRVLWGEHPELTTNPPLLAEFLPFTDDITNADLRTR